MPARAARARKPGTSRRWTALVGALALLSAAGGAWLAARSAGDPGKTSRPEDRPEPVPSPGQTERRVGEADRMAGLEADLIAADRFARENPDRLHETLARWEELRRSAEGTALQGYADTMVESARQKCEEETATAWEAVSKSVGAHVAFHRWDEAEAELDRFDTDSLPPPLAERCAKLREEIARRREAFESGGVYMYADFERGEQEFLHSEGLELQVREVIRSTTGGSSPHLKFLVPGESVAIFTFPVSSPAKTVYLRLLHVSSLVEGDRYYSPVTIALNGTILAGNWSPSNRSWEFLSRWDVSGLLREGANDLAIQLEGGYSHYWLKYVEVSILP